EPPREIYGKVMSIPDSLIVDYFELVTDVPEEEIDNFREQLKTPSANAMNIKKRLAYEIVRQFHGEQAANEEQEYFEKKYQKRELHKVETRVSIGVKASVRVIWRRDIPKWLVNNKFANSVSEAKRLLAQGAVQIIKPDGTRLVVKDEEIKIESGDRIKVGKLHLAEIVDADKKKA
ncbi:MAG: tyrosine--tRNA ligase, partial [Dehalococcoidia bacterium]|nr:tyrosine--tRNA ligase [Dehalococcoidia bacterium]